MSYRPTDTSEKALEALIVAELTGRTGRYATPVGEIRDYASHGESDETSTARASEEHRTGDIIVENEWQRFHIKKYRELELKTPLHKYNPGRYIISAKVGISSTIILRRLSR